MTIKTSFLKLALTSFAALFLAACAQNKPAAPLGGVSSVTMIKTDDDHYKKLAENYKGEQTFEVRTVHSEGGDAWTAPPEITGATCEVKHEYFTASVVTPHAIRVPLYGSQTREFTVTCEKNGFQQSVQIIGPYNVSQANRTGTGVQAAGLLGLLVAQMINEASDPEDDQFEYLPVAVRLAPVLTQDDELPEGSQVAAKE